MASILCVSATMVPGSDDPAGGHEAEPGEATPPGGRGKAQGGGTADRDSVSSRKVRIQIIH